MRAVIHAVATGVVLVVLVAPFGASAQGATPEAPFRCDEGMATSPPMGTPSVALGSVSDAEPTITSESIEFDQVYIDFMIPHHSSIIALARTALPRLSDERLITIAEHVISREEAELVQLRLYREEFYGSVRPLPLDAAMMERVAEAIPPLPDEHAIRSQVDREKLISDFCTADSPDLAFIDLTLSHHEMAITASVVAFVRAVHPETHRFAKAVVETQQNEVDELTAIRADLRGTGTPTS